MRRFKLPICLCAFVMLFAFLPSLPTNPHSAQPFNSIALAGHSTVGGEACTCGCSGCICDPGETRVACGNSVSLEPDSKPSGDTLPVPESSGDGGAFLF